MLGVIYLSHPSTRTYRWDVSDAANIKWMTLVIAKKHNFSI